MHAYGIAQHSATQQINCAADILQSMPMDVTAATLGYMFVCHFRIRNEGCHSFVIDLHLIIIAIALAAIAATVVAPFYFHQFLCD